MMRILVTGSGAAGSWIVRGEQIGNALGATVKSHATLADCQAHDVILVVKRISDELLQNIRASGRPWLYDILDAYPQKDCATWCPRQARTWLQMEIKRLQPTDVIFPNQKMRSDAESDGSPVIYHHARPAQRINPIRAELKVIGFEGHPRYLGDLAATILKICKRHNFDFLVNPPDLAILDVVLAVRAAPWNSYAAHHWKSNIKLANAHATGTPFIGPEENGYLETATGAELLSSSPTMLEQHILALRSQEERWVIQQRFLNAARPLSVAAAETLQALRNVV